MRAALRAATVAAPMGVVDSVAESSSPCYYYYAYYRSPSQSRPRRAQPTIALRVRNLRVTSMRNVVCATNLRASHHAICNYLYECSRLSLTGNIL